MSRIFQRIPGTNVTLVKSRDISVMQRLALVRPWISRSARTGALLLLSRHPIAGTVAKSRKGWRIYVSPLHAGGMTLSQIIAHERFHTLPVAGLSEIAAHFWGGLHRRPGRLSWKYGLHDVLTLAFQRPVRFITELIALPLLILALS
jgi:hypothetical protein